MALATGEGGGWLAEFDVAQSHILNGLDLPKDVWNIFKKFNSLVDGHVKNIGNGLAFIPDLQSLAVVPFAMTYLTGNLDVGQEIHLDSFIAVTAASFTTSAFHIKGETAWFVASDLGFWEIDKQAADVAKHTRVGGWVASRCPT